MSGGALEKFAKFIGHSFFVVCVIGFAVVLAGCVIIGIFIFISDKNEGGPTASPVQTPSTVASAAPSSPVSSVVQNDQPPVPNVVTTYVTNNVIVPVPSPKERYTESVSEHYLFIIDNDTPYMVFFRLKALGKWGSDYNISYGPGTSSQVECSSSDIQIAFNPSVPWQSEQAYRIDNFFYIIDRSVLDDDWAKAPHYRFQMRRNGQLDLFTDTSQFQH
jgi:hypothetical protein